MAKRKESFDAALAAPKLVERALEDRIAGLQRWLSENAPGCEDKQKHLDAGTPERAYWHYGYMVALRDTLALIRRQEDS